MKASMLTATIQEDRAVARVETYELIDEQTVCRFRDELMTVVNSGVRSIDLDMSNVRMLSSVALCAVITVDRKLKDAGGHLRLREVSSNCLDVFEYMRLHELLDISPAQDETPSGPHRLRTLAG